MVHTPHEGPKDAARSTIPPSLKLTEAESRQYAELGCVVKEVRLTATPSGLILQPHSPLTELSRSFDSEPNPFQLTEFVRTLQSVLDPEFVKELQAETDRLLADAAGLTPSTASARYDYWHVIANWLVGRFSVDITMHSVAPVWPNLQVLRHRFWVRL